MTTSATLVIYAVHDFYANERKALPRALCQFGARRIMIEASTGANMDVRIFLAAAIAVATRAQAQQVHKCMEAGKPVYQSQPCANGQPVKSWSAAVAPRSAETLAAERDIATMRRENEQRHQPRTRTHVRQGVVIPNGQASPSRCQAAKDHRDSVYEAVGVKRTFALSRTLDDAVYQACK